MGRVAQYSFCFFLNTKHILAVMVFNMVSKISPWHRKYNMLNNMLHDSFLYHNGNN